MNAEISGALYFFPRISTHADPSSLLITLYGRTLIAFCTSPSSNRRPIRRLIAKTVLVGFVIAWRFAICPVSLSLDSVNATTDGVVRLPSELAITTGSPPSIIATQLLVVPKSIPITFAIFQEPSNRSITMFQEFSTSPSPGSLSAPFPPLFAVPLATETRAGRSVRSPIW